MSNWILKKNKTKQNKQTKKKKKKQSVKNETVQAKELFWGLGLEGVLRKMVLLKSFLFQRFLKSILCLGNLQIWD